MMHEQLARWFDETVERMRVSGSFFETDHVTAIDGIPDSPDIKTLAAVLTQLGSLARGHGEGIVPVLVVPLGVSEVLDPHPPELAGVAFGSKPPSFYLMEPRQFSRWSDREEYRSPYLAHPGGLLIEYVCGRSIQMREEGWEYSRALFMRTTSDGISRFD
ncbi:hypothetical protein [Agromyces soli]|uniref:Uncharacterized protein n=1 Tax=Agromyces soli TaxID=659012 RepID=A0ABY4AWE8_9MICO|nr:hypothetical protein [Agromyces soli]UOE27522.1 hypothetical protein MTP13_07020 [Agromyces soli]